MLAWPGVQLLDPQGGALVLLPTTTPSVPPLHFPQAHPVLSTSRWGSRQEFKGIEYTLSELPLCLACFPQIPCVLWGFSEKQTRSHDAEAVLTIGIPCCSEIPSNKRDFTSHK